MYLPNIKSSVKHKELYDFFKRHELWKKIYKSL